MTHLSDFISKCQLSEHLVKNRDKEDYPAELQKEFPAALFLDAQQTIAAWESYEPTKLHSLAMASEALGIAEILYKDESTRFGLGSFKALGGAYAVEKLLAGRAPSSVTVATATDGNHGRSVAWGAKRAGCNCVIYIHKEVSEGRERAMAELGAKVVRIDGDYDESVRLCAAESAENNWEVVSDTSWEGYEQTPKLVMAGYTMMVREILSESDEPPTHIILQAGVGGLAGAITAAFWQEMGEKLPHITIVESMHSACIMASAKSGSAATVDIAEETMMAGLSCGEASPIAWRILQRTAGLFVTIPDDAIPTGMRLMARGEAGPAIEAGECALPGLVALTAITQDQSLKHKTGMDENSRVLIFGCEGATDRSIYERILAE